MTDKILGEMVKTQEGSWKDYLTLEGVVTASKEMDFCQVLGIDDEHIYLGATNQADQAEIIISNYKGEVKERQTLPGDPKERSLVDEISKEAISLKEKFSENLTHLAERFVPPETFPNYEYFKGVAEERYGKSETTIEVQEDRASLVTGDCEIIFSSIWFVKKYRKKTIPKRFRDKSQNHQTHSPSCWGTVKKLEMKKDAKIYTIMEEDMDKNYPEFTQNLIYNKGVLIATRYSNTFDERQRKTCVDYAGAHIFKFI